MLAIVEPVADNEFIGNFKSPVGDLHLPLSASRFIQQGDHRERGRSPAPQEVEEISHRPARIDDILNHEHVPPGDRLTQVGPELDLFATLGIVAIGVHTDVVEAQGDGDLPRKVSEKDHGPFEDTDQHEVFVFVVARDLTGKLLQATGDLCFGYQDPNRWFLAVVGHELSFERFNAIQLIRFRRL